MRLLCSAAGSINSGRHVLESGCAERYANDAFLTSFRASLGKGTGRAGVKHRTVYGHLALGGGGGLPCAKI